MYKVMYRCEQPEYIQKITNNRYITITVLIGIETKKEAIKEAVSKNNHVKKFHSEHFGKRVYFVKKEK